MPRPAPNIRRWLALVLGCAIFAARVPAQERLPPVEEGYNHDGYSDDTYHEVGLYPDDCGAACDLLERGGEYCPDEYCDEYCDDYCGNEYCGTEWAFPGIWVPSWFDGWHEKLRFRNSNTDGRWTGQGQPLRSTSWLNRPYEFGLDVGAFVMGSRITTNNSRNNDLLAAAHLGWDWDHYWGAQMRIAWTTPELTSTVSSDDLSSNNLFIYDATLLYYPWGDSRVRPYYRFGFGLTDVDFINYAGEREDDMLFTMPLGVGIKYQTKRWMALRAEVIDHITWGQNSASDMQNFTLSLGLEWRYGGRPTSTWSSPSHRKTW